MNSIYQSQLIISSMSAARLTFEHHANKNFNETPLVSTGDVQNLLNMWLDQIKRSQSFRVWNHYLKINGFPICHVLSVEVWGGNKKLPSSLNPNWVFWFEFFCWWLTPISAHTCVITKQTHKLTRWRCFLSWGNRAISIQITKFTGIDAIKLFNFGKIPKCPLCEIPESPRFDLVAQAIEYMRQKTRTGVYALVSISPRLANLRILSTLERRCRNLLKNWIVVIVFSH